MKNLERLEKPEMAKEAKHEDLWGQKLESIYIHGLSEWLEEMINPGETVEHHTSPLDDSFEQHEYEPTDKDRELTTLFVGVYIDWKFGNDE